MRRGGNGNRSHGKPSIYFTKYRSEQHTQRKQGINKHGCFPRLVRIHPAIDKPFRKPSAKNTSKGRHNVNNRNGYRPLDYHVLLTFGHMPRILPFQKRRQPKQEEPPNWIRQELSEEKRPGLTISQQPKPSHLFCRGRFSSDFVLITVYVVVFSLREFVLCKFFLGALVRLEPE